MKQFPFSRQSQIRKGWEYNKVYDQGKRLHGEGFTLVCRANDLGHSRIGVSINRKVRGAVRRNRIKRIIRESFRLSRRRYPDRADIVFTVRSDFTLSSPDAISQAVERLTRKWKTTHGG